MLKSFLLFVVHFRILALSLPLGLVLIMSSATQAGADQELKYTQLLERIAEPNELIWLNSTTRFACLYREEQTLQAEGAVVLIHSSNSHADAPAVIQPLRTRLPIYGWKTLSIQLPAPSRNANLDSYAALIDESIMRIRATIEHLKQNDIHNIVLLGYDFGAIVAAAYIIEHPNQAITGFIGISMPGHITNDPRMFTANSLKQITLPVLDISASQDLSHVTEHVKTRAKAAKLSGLRVSRLKGRSTKKTNNLAARIFDQKQGLITYRQFVIQGADYFYTGFDAVLVKRVQGWLHNHVRGITISKKQITNL